MAMTPLGRAQPTRFQDRADVGSSALTQGSHFSLTVKLLSLGLSASTGTKGAARINKGWGETVAYHMAKAHGYDKRDFPRCPGLEEPGVWEEVLGSVGRRLLTPWWVTKP